MSSKKRKHSVSVTAPVVDVVISTGGRWDFLKTCLESLKKQTVPVNICVIDNATDSDEKRQNLILFEGINSKRLQQHLGFPAANNEGARMGRAPFILFLNDDCSLEEDAVERMLGMFQDEKIGIVGARLLFPDNSTSPNHPAGKIQHVGLALNIRGDVVHPLMAWSDDNPRTKVTREVFGVTGACLMVRRHLFNKVRGFSLVYGEGTFEDVELCLQIRSLGYRVVVNSEATGHHYAGATAEKTGKSFPILMNNMMFKSRWAGTPFLVWDEYSFYDVVLEEPAKESRIDL